MVEDVNRYFDGAEAGILARRALALIAAPADRVQRDCRFEHIIHAKEVSLAAGPLLDIMVEPAFDVFDGIEGAEIESAIPA